MMFVVDGVMGAAILVVIGVFAGNWLDAKLHTAPWLSVGLSMAGGGLGLWRLCVKALALDDGSKVSIKGRESKTSSNQISESGRSVQDGSASAPKAAYERFMDEEKD